MVTQLNQRCFACVIMLLIASLLTCGCNAAKESGVTAIGQVTISTEPLSGGVVTFEPLSPTTGPNASVPVFGGQFNVPASANLHGGRYRVRIAMIPAELRNAIPAEHASSFPPDDAVIAPAFDTDSKMTCELKPNQENVLAFEVEFLK